MGRIIKGKIENLVPTQDFLLKEKCKKILDAFLDNPGDIVVPVKRVEKYERRYYNLDGHNDSSMYQLLNQLFDINLYFWVAENQKDFILNNMNNLYQNNFSGYNENIYKRFDYVSNIPKYLSHPKSIPQLMSKYDWLQNPETMLYELQKQEN